MQKPIVVVGSINLDLVVATDRTPRVGETVLGRSFNTFFGGKGANQAVAVAKLSYPTAMVGNVGNDAFGAQLRKGLGDAGVDTTYIDTVEDSSGIALITTGLRGENSIVVVPGANGHLTPELLKRAVPLIERAGFLLAQLEIPLETVEYLAQLAVKYEIPLMLDPAPARELPGALLRKVSWLTPNETETHELLKANLNDGDESLPATGEKLLALGVGNALVKLGARGCLIVEKSKRQELVPAFPVQAVDTTAAGDAFNAGFAVGLLRGYPPYQSAIFASAVAAISVTRPGAQPSMPSANEVDSFLVEYEAAPDVR